MQAEERHEERCVGVGVAQKDVGVGQFWVE